MLNLEPSNYEELLRTTTHQRFVYLALLCMGSGTTKNVTAYSLLPKQISV
jgi:hypothetical protein